MNSKISDFGFRNENHPSPYVLSPEGEVKVRRGRGTGEGKFAIRNPQSRGFTLLEVLLAMAILAVIMTVIYTAFSTSSRNLAQAEKLRDETDMARALMSRLSADIANAYCKPSSATNVPTVFYGQKEEEQSSDDGSGNKIRHDSISLTTLTNWPKSSKETELWEVGYFFKEKPEGKGYTLFRREKRELSKDIPALEGGDEYEITDKIKSLQFRYSQDGKNWTDNGWDKRTQAPKAVEIVVTLDSGKVYATKVDVGNPS